MNFFTIIALMIGPFFSILAFNQLGADIELTWQSWLAMFWLTFLLTLIVNYEGVMLNAKIAARVDTSEDQSISD